MKEVSKEQYLQVFKGNKLELMGTFSDPEGDSHIGYGCPAMDTSYGIDDVVYTKIESRKENKEDEKWTDRFFINEDIQKDTLTCDHYWKKSSAFSGGEYCSKCYASRVDL